MNPSLFWAKASWKLPFLLLFAMLAAVQFAAAQSTITRVEYYVDVDPGHGNATPLSFTPNMHLANLQIQIDPTGLESGIHQVGARAQSSDGTWSLDHRWLFFKPYSNSTGSLTTPNLTYVEYYIDTDPGYGNGIPVSVGSTTNASNVMIPIDPGPLSSGIHQFGVRARDANGAWGLDHRWLFFKPYAGSTAAAQTPNITYGEWYIDTDPGYGAATPVNFSASTSVDNLLINIDPSTLSNGIHQFGFRTRDANGAWSLDHRWLFFKPYSGSSTSQIRPNITYAEWYLDNDPGHGQATPISLTPGVEANSLLIQLDPATLSSGIHQIGVRSRDANGAWSLDHRWLFFKPYPNASTAAPLPNITYLEYFIDTDPGLGAATSIPFNTGTDINNLGVPVDISTLTLGDHYFYLRAKDANGSWSLIHKYRFSVHPITNVYVTIGQLNEVPCAGNNFNIPFTVNSPFGTNNTFTAQLSDSLGLFTNPVNIGTLNAYNSDTIRATIPSWIPYGTKYRVRILSTAPVDTSVTNTNPLTINSIPGSGFSISGALSSCLETKTYTPTGTTGTNLRYQWTLSGGGTLDTTTKDAVVTWTTAGTHTLKLLMNNACGSSMEKLISITVNSVPPSVAPTITAANRLLSASALPTGQGITGYQWYRHDTLLAGATGSSYLAAIDGSYAVAYINACGAGVKSQAHVVATLQTQTISFDSIPNKIFGDGPFVIHATASSGLPVTFQRISGPVTLNNDTVTLTGVGTAVIEAQQAGNNYYAAATPVRRTFTVAPDMRAPDLTVLNVTSNTSLVSPRDTVQLSWTIKNIGLKPSPVNWTERIYMQSSTGQNKTLLRQLLLNNGSTLDSSASLPRTEALVIPAQLNIGDDGVFLVEIVPASVITEVPGGGTNNSGVEHSPWQVRKLLTLELSSTQLTEGAAGTISASVKRTGSLSNALSITPTLSFAQRFSLPAIITIPAGQAGASFTIGAVNNTTIEGIITDTLQLSAASFEGAKGAITLLDDDKATLTITGLATQAFEGDTVTFQVATNFVSNTSLQVLFTSNGPTAFPLPSSVTIPAGASTAPVTVVLKQDSLPEVDLNVNLIAGATNHNPAQAGILLKDDDLPNLELVFQTNLVAENAGPFATQATLRRLPGSKQVAFTAHLSASLPNTLLLPSSITLAAGENQKTFTVGVIDNTFVDSTRQVNVTAAVFVSSCGCAAPPSSSGSITASLSVSDNDGASLQLTTPQLTLPEGVSNAGMLRITRNTSTAQPLTVQLSSSDTTEATVPGSVIIPAGQAFVDVPITTKSDTLSDGNQQVYFQASSSGFSTGSLWIVVTDLNKPDLQIPFVTLNQGSVTAMQLFNYQLSIKNTGMSAAPAGVKVKGYLSKDGTIDATDSLVSEDIVTASIASGQTASVLNAVQAPNTPGQYKLLFKVNPDATLTELLLTNNTSNAVNLTIGPNYTATATVALPYYNKGVPVPITGQATKSNGTPASKEQVEVYVITNGLRRTILTRTDSLGQYATQFIPLTNEAGHYKVGASYPGLGATAAQDSFDILGVMVNNGTVPQLQVLIQDTVVGTMPLKNLSQTALNNFTLQAIQLPNGASIKFDTLPVLAGNANVAIGYRVVGNSLTAGTHFEVAKMRAVATQGTIQNTDLFYYCQAPNGFLEPEVDKINVKVSQSKGEKIVELRLFNKGVGSSGAIAVSLPQVAWLSSISPTPINAVQSGDTAIVILKFKALAEVPFDFAINGSIAIQAQNGNSLTVPFTFEKVSETTGAVKVIVTNQYTYYTPGEPKVAGARVRIKNYFSGALYAEGLTDSAGQFYVSGIPEGRHRVTVEKDKHQPYSGTITIDPGDTVSSTVFINYQAITFSWNVVPTAIQDQYDITLTTQFETHVPKPVVTIDMPKVMPALSGSETYAFNVTLTNHGLITAEQVSLNLPTSDPEYEFITNYITADLLAQQSIQVPVIMRRRGTGTGGRYGGPTIEAVSKFLGMSPGQYAGLRTNSLNCQDFTGVVYGFKCNLSSGQWETTGALFTYQGRSCTGGGLGSNEILIGGGGFPYNGNGIYYNIPCLFCGGGGSGTGTTPVYDQEKSNCVDCLKALYEALKDCIAEPPPAIDCGIETYLDQGGAGDYAKCLIESAVMGPIDDAIDKIVDKIPYLNKLLCIKAVMEAIKACLESMEERVAHGRMDARVSNNSSGLMQTFANKYEKVANAYQLRVNWINEYYGDLSTYNAWPRLYTGVRPYLDSLDTIPTTVQNAMYLQMAGFDIPQQTIQAFFQRWNLSIQARNANVLVPNSQYPGIINWLNVKRWSDSLVNTHNYAVANGHANIDDLYTDTRAELDTFLQMQMNAVCAKVTVQFSQQLTMTREAFEGTLEIFNGHPTDAMDSLSVNILIKDENGVPSNGVFQIQNTSATNVGNITGTGALASQQKGTVKFLFIPEVGAAPQTPKVYNFSGSVRYWDPYVDTIVTMPLSDVPITVNPSPNLMLHYFMQRNILGDDALTNPEIEPSVPAELAVMVENHGYGPAVNMAISSAQPKIVENEKGLAINFNLIGSSFQGQPTNFGVTNINFGTVPALQTRIGRWYFTSSLLGKFISYEADVVHANSFGNPELSLVKGVQIHELTKSVRGYGSGHDGMNDFLVNDIFDVQDAPDVIYFSEGKRTDKVYPAGSGQFSAPVGPPSFTNTLTVTPSDTGWNYLKLQDPGNGRYTLLSVTRSDGQVIPLDNAWLTFVTLPLNNPPVYENRFHLVDTFPSLSTVTYTVVWKPKNLNVPKILRFDNPPPAITSVKVDSIVVVFDKAIDASTFTHEDLTLTFQGGSNLITSTVKVTQLDTATFSIHIGALTTGNGFYNLTVQAANVKDIFGITGATGKQLTWSQFLTVPTVQAFTRIPVSRLAASYDTIGIQFNLPIDETSVTPQRFTILKGGVVQSGSLVIDSVSSDKKLFYLSGLGAILTQSGEYELRVDLPNIKTTTQVFGVQVQSVTLTVDNLGPTLLHFDKWDSGGLDSQHIPFVKMAFDEGVVGFNTAALQLTRNGEAIPLNIAQLSNTDFRNWTAGNFGLLTYPDGTYTLTINLALIKDSVGNSGTGTQQVSWVVDRAALITLSTLTVTPDKGYSASDGVTSNPALQVGFTLNGHASKITVSQVDITGGVVLATLSNVASGTHSVPITLLTQGHTGIRVTATGVNGGTATLQKGLFLDATPLAGNWILPNVLELTRQFDSLNIAFNAKLLQDTGLLRFTQLVRNGLILPTNALTWQKVGDTLYRLSGIRGVSTAPGIYALKLPLDSLVKYSSGKEGATEALVTWTVQQANRPPVAKAGKDTVVTTIGTFALNAQGSFDPDGQSITYKWIAPAGITLSDTTSATPSFPITPANQGGVYDFLLVVSDGQQFTTDVVRVTVSLANCATEVCNGMDDDCDGLIDEGFQVYYFRDSDGDGFGSNVDSLLASECIIPSGYALLRGDCNDADSTVYPASDGYGCGVCATDGVTFASRTNNGASYQWQVDNGGGFQDLAEGGVYTGTGGKYLSLTQPPTSWTRYKYRCRITNGNAVTYSPEYVLKFTFIWKGTASEAWEDPQNWSCGKVPDEYTDVIISSARPVQLSSHAKVMTLTLQTGANMQVKTAYQIEVKQ